MTNLEHAYWLADKIVAYDDYTKEAAIVLRKQADEIESLRQRAQELESVEHPAYAGVEIWIGQNSVKQLITKQTLEHEINEGLAITTAAQRCLDVLAAAPKYKGEKE